MKSKYSGLIVATVIAMCIFSNFIALAGAARGFNYQAVVRNGTGAALPNQHVNLQFTLRSDSLTGGVVYRERDSVIANQQGIFTVVIGGGDLVAGNFDSISWGQSSFYLQVEMDITGGTTFIDMGTTQLLSVPYSMYAQSAGAIDLTPTVYPTITGNDTITVGTSGYLVVNSTQVPSNAKVALTAGVYPGQILCIAGMSPTSKGVRFTNGGTLNIGTSGGPIDVQTGDVLTLMWSGYQWLKMSYSSNQ